MRRSTLKAILDSEHARRQTAEWDLAAAYRANERLEGLLVESWRREHDGSTLADLRREVSSLRTAHLFVLNQNAQLTLELEAIKGNR